MDEETLDDNQPGLKQTSMDSVEINMSQKRLPNEEYDVYKARLQLLRKATKQILRGRIQVIQKLEKAK